jgi:cellulose synthase/poly-beta-1,6-N-acetylglucosamine synthase-like glycosyltransferase
MHVAGALRENSTLQHLDFSCNRIQNEGETYMAYAIQGHPSLSSITFGDGASAVSLKNSMEQHHVSGANVTSTRALIIAAFLPVCAELTTVTFDPQESGWIFEQALELKQKGAGFEAGSQVHLKIAQYFEGTLVKPEEEEEEEEKEEMQSRDDGTNHAHDRSAFSTSDFARQAEWKMILPVPILNCNLRELDLCASRAPAAIAAAFIQRCTLLSRLVFDGLEGADISSETLQHKFATLQQKYRVEIFSSDSTIDIRTKTVTDAGAVILASFIPKCKVLECFKTPDSRLSDEAARVIACALAEMTKLSSVDTPKFSVPVRELKAMSVEAISGMCSEFRGEWETTDVIFVWACMNQGVAFAIEAARGMLADLLTDNWMQSTVGRELLQSGNETELRGHLLPICQEAAKVRTQWTQIASPNSDTIHLQMKLSKAARELACSKFQGDMRHMYTTEEVRVFSAKKKGVLVDKRSQFADDWNICAPPHTGANFSTMLYTPVACKKPRDFSGTRMGAYADGYTIRSEQNGHHIDYFIAVTMYNEDAGTLRKALSHIADCLKYMQKIKGDHELWKRFMVCIVSDGRTKANEGTLQYLTKIGNFDKQTMAINSQGLGVMCHLFESTPQLVKKHDSLTSTVVYYPPLQLMFALKEHNAGLLDCHQWVFSAFAEKLQPTFVCLMCVHTLPSESAIYWLMRSMEKDKQIAGVCGETAVDQTQYGFSWLNPVIAAQIFEFKIATAMDRALNSLCGFQFIDSCESLSAYRFDALRGTPLCTYFKPLDALSWEFDLLESNRNLTAGRALCFEIVTRQNCAWLLRYEPNAIAYVDVPQTIVDFLQQRRRWLNGHFMSTFFEMTHVHRLWVDPEHPICRKAMLTFFLIFQFLRAVVALVLPVVHLMTVHAVLKLSVSNWIVGFVVCVWLILVVLLFVTSLSSRPSWIPGFHTFSMHVFGIVQVGVFVLLVYQCCLMFMQGSREWTMLQGTAEVTCSVSKLNTELAAGHLHNDTTVSSICPNYDLHFAAEFAPRSFQFKFQQQLWSFCILTSEQMVILMMLSVGSFVIAGCLHGQIHHMMLSFVQYLYFLPSATIVAVVYAACKVSDVCYPAAATDQSHRRREVRHIESVVAQTKVVGCLILTNAAIGAALLYTNLPSMCFLIGVCYVFACMNSIRLLGSILFQFHRTFSFLCGCFKDRWFACVGKPHAETRELQARVDYGYVALKDHTDCANDSETRLSISLEEEAVDDLAQAPCTS